MLKSRIGGGSLYLEINMPSAKKTATNWLASLPGVTVEPEEYEISASIEDSTVRYGCLGNYPGACLKIAGPDGHAYHYDFLAGDIESCDEQRITYGELRSLGLQAILDPEIDAERTDPRAAPRRPRRTRGGRPGDRPSDSAKCPGLLRLR
jgi:hypothetical protein